MEINYFKELWEKRQKADLGASEAFWDQRAEEFNQGTDGDGERLGKIVQLLKEKGVLASNKKVLDIGSGTGRFAFQFAPLVAEVAGVDLSARMISFAQENADKKGITNVHFEKLDWGALDLEERGWQKKFDLVFAANCPGVNNLEALEKIIHASRGYCFISSFVARKDSLKDQLTALFNQGQEAHRSKHKVGFYSIFNILWLMGYYPEVQYADGTWEHVMTKAEALKYYENYFIQFKALDSRRKDILVKFLDEKADQDGFITDQVTAKFVWIYWPV